MERRTEWIRMVGDGIWGYSNIFSKHIKKAAEHFRRFN
jgi:hypothetical protein